MPSLPPHESIAAHAPLLAVLAEQLQTEAELALAAEAPAQQFLRLGGMLALARLVARESTLLSDALRTPPATLGGE